MKQWYQLLVNHLNEHPPNYGDGDAESILEMVYSYYNQYNRMDTASIKNGVEKLYAEMVGMLLREVDDIIYTTCTLPDAQTGWLCGGRQGRCPVGGRDATVSCRNYAEKCKMRHLVVAGATAWCRTNKWWKISIFGGRLLEIFLDKNGYFPLYKNDIFHIKLV